MTVLDSSALLALLYFEPGHERVAELAPDAWMSTVNLAEVLARLARDHRPLDVALGEIDGFGIRWAGFDRAQAIEAAALAPHTIPFGLSLGDRACLALARLRGVPAVTADRAWARIELGVPIEVIR